MTIYSVHVSESRAGAANEPERVHFERQSFAWAAFFFGPLWLLARRLWRALLAWLIGAVLVIAAANQGFISDGAAALIIFLAELYLGLAGSSIAAASYDRGRWRVADIVTGPDRTTAERTFFSRASLADAPARRAAPPPPPPGGDVIGLFPESGRNR